MSPNAHQSLRVFMPALLLSIILIAFSSAAFGSDDLKSLYAAHHWFQLRDALSNNPSAPLFYRAAVALAFNDTERGEREMLLFLKSSPTPAEAYEAHDMLEDLYWRTGKFRQSLVQHDQAASLHQKSQDPADSRAMLEALSQYPDMTIAQFQPSSIHVWCKNDFVPLTINGKSFKCFLDTGANISVISESAARRLRLAILEVNGTRVADYSGNGITVKQVAVAEKLKIGNIQLEHVPFIVVSDRAQPFADWSAGKRCILGIQVFLACQTVKWKSASIGAILELGAPSKARNLSDSNLCFDGTMPHVRADFGQHPIDFLLDTGSGATILKPSFTKDFPDVVTGAKTTTQKIEGIGGTAIVRTSTLPELCVRLGGLQLTIRPISVELGETGKQAPQHHGVLGADFMKASPEVTFDFEAMTLTLH